MRGITSQSSKRARMIAVAFGVALLSLALLGLTMTTMANTSSLAGQALDIAGYEDFVYNTATNTPVPNHPTSEKPESKLWWHDGFWWGILYNLNAGAYHIYRLDWGDQTWEDTGIVVDEREESRADVLFDATNSKLYISSHSHDESPGKTSNQDKWPHLYRYSYDMALQTYVLDSGFPVYTNQDTALAQVIDKDSDGRLWTTYVSRDPQGTGEYEVYVNATTSAGLAGDDSWDIPFSLVNLFSEARVTREDISTIFAYSETVALMWSNQLSNTLNFATHTAGMDLSTGWSHMTVTIPGPVDDHINVKVRETAGGDQIFAALKLGYDFLPTVPPPTSTYPLVGLLTRDTDGTFAFHEYSAVADNDTRPIVTIDDQNDKVYVFVSGKAGGSKICYKMATISAPLTNIVFTPGNCGVDFIADTTVNKIDSPTSAKHHFNDTTGLGILATNSDSNFIYVHNVLGDPPPAVLAVTPDRGEADVAVDGVVQATFSKDMDDTTLTDSSFSLAGPDGLVAGSVAYAGSTRTATFTPGADLVANTLYTATVSDTIVDSGGLALFRPITWTFTTVSPTIAFDQPSYSVGEAALTATITVTLNTPSSQLVTVDYATADGSATAGLDYTSASGQIAFGPGTMSQSFEVAILNDGIDEANETIQLLLSNASGASLDPAGDQADLTIIDDEGQPTVQFEPTAVDASEDAGVATIQATLSHTSSLTITVDYISSDGTATSGLDYTTVSDTLTFDPGQTTATFDVPVLADDIDEPNETVLLTLSNPDNAGLGVPADEAILTLLDADSPPTVQFADVAFDAVEGEGPALITATLSHLSAFTVMVDYVSGTGTAVPGVDYTPVNDTLTFAPGTITGTFSVPLIDDNIDESDETIPIQLSDPISATLGAPSETALSILDDEPTPQISFEAADYIVAENVPTKTITLTLSGPSAQTVAVDYATADGTAMAGQDYTSTSGTVEFLAGELSQSFDVAILDDLLVEPDETVGLTLDNFNGASAGALTMATLTINDDEPKPTVNYSADDYPAEEDAGTVAITVTLDMTSTQPISVTYVVTDGLAVAPNDYLASTDLLLFAPGTSTQSFTVDLVDDTIDEPPQTVELGLLNPLNAQLGDQAQATVTILDNDAAPQLEFASSAYSVDEGAGPATITVTLSAASEFSVTVPYTVSDGTATAPGDFTAESGSLTLEPGATEGTFAVSLVNDAIDETDETVDLTLGQPANATLGALDAATLTILDDDDPPTVHFSTTSYRTAEGVPAVTITATLDIHSELVASVYYTTSDGTATSGLDYIPTNGQLLFNPGDTTATFDVTIIDDGDDEPEETILLVLGNPGNAILGSPSQSVIIIEDNDGFPSVRLSSAAYSAGEGAGTAVVTATLTAESGFTVEVDYATSDDTAIAGSDYTAISGTLSFAPGETTAAVEIPLTDDALDEADETFLFSLSNPQQATLSAPDHAAVTIVDDDGTPQVHFSDASYTVAEGSGGATITVTLSAPSALAVSVPYTITSGTAATPGDYTATNGSLLFPAGVTSQTFSVTIVDDVIDEPDETVNLALGQPSNAMPGAPSTATLTIIDDDEPPQVHFSDAEYTVIEGAGGATITVTLSAPSAMTVSATYTITAGTATEGDDFTAGSGSLLFPAGVTSQTFSVTIVDDAIDEPAETVNLALGDFVNGHVGSPSAAVLTIEDDDDAPKISFSMVNYQVTEKAMTATLTVELSQPSGFEVQVDYATEDGTALAGSDYVATSDMLSFKPGDTVQTITIPIIADDASEDTETLFVQLSDPVHGALGMHDRATLQILDDDKYFIFLPLAVRS